jgi:DNA-binding NarL/FixJ family response regulator
MKRELTHHELRIIALIAAGNTARQIAAELNKSPRTIEKQKNEIFFVMEVTNAAALVAICIRKGLIS